MAGQEPESQASNGEWRWRVAAVVAAVMSVATFVHVVITVSSRVVSLDGVVLWYAAPEWAHLRFHEPAFYGQSYGATVMAIPMAVLQAVGIGYRWGLPIGMAASMLVCWWALGFGAWRRGHRLTPIVAFAAPALLSAYWLVYVTTAPVERAFALVGVGAGMLLARPRRSPVTGVAVAMIGVGTIVDMSALVLTLPVALWWLLDRPARAHRVAAVFGLSATVGYLALRLWFYARHPDFNAGGSLPIAASWSTLGESLSHPYAVFRMFSLEILREWWMPIGVGVAIVVTLLARRRWQLALPAVLVVVVSGYAISTPRAVDRSALFLPPARILLFVPFAVWFLVFLFAESRPRVPAWIRPATAVLVVLVAVVSVGERFIGLGTHSPDDVLQASLHTQGTYGFYRVAEIERACDRIDREVRRDRVEVSVLVDTLDALLCAGRTGNRLTTVNLPYDRRTWVLDEAATRRVGRIYLEPAVPGLCREARRRDIACRRRGRGALLVTSPQPVLNTLALLGLRVRPFGPGCVITRYRCSAGTDARNAFPLVTDGPGAPQARFEAVVRELAAGDVSSVEPGPNRRADVRRVARALRRPGRDFVIGTVRPTGSSTARAPGSVSGHRLSAPVQFVLVDRRWRLARRSLCAVAQALRVECRDPYELIPD